MTIEIAMAVIGALLVLALNWRAMKSHWMPARKLVSTALIWLGIIIVLTAAIRLLGNAA